MMLATGEGIAAALIHADVFAVPVAQLMGQRKLGHAHFAYIASVAR
jgi:hypothetical protein